MCAISLYGRIGDRGEGREREMCAISLYGRIEVMVERERDVCNISVWEDRGDGRERERCVQYLCMGG